MLSAWVFTSFWLCVIWYVAAAPVKLELNPKATIYNEIKAVTHDADQRTVVIDLHESRRCESPTFMIRLSGRSLYLLDLVQHDHSPLTIKAVKEYFYPRASSYVFSYPPLVDPGAYFLEVLVMFCTTFDPNDFRHICLEDIQEGRSVINLPYTFTVPTLELPTEKKLEPRARWVLSNNVVNASLLPTRYQRSACGDGVYCDAQWSDLQMHREFDWIDKPDWSNPLSTVLNKSDATGIDTKATPAMINVCFIGASHARELMIHGQELKSTRNKVMFTWIESKYPSHFNLQAAIDQQCSYAVIGYGQWPASYYEKVPWPQHRYANEMRNMMVNVKAHTGPVQLFLRSVNYNALGAIITHCPPVDHRSPPVIAMYNSVIKSLTTELGIGYIDLNHIMGPMWDSALDWCHPKGKVFVAEVEHILYTIFTSSIKQNKFPKLVAGPPPPKENSLYRFNGDQTVFLYKDGLLRSFPNGRTFMAMGYDFDNVIVLVEGKRRSFDFGGELPSM